MLKYGLAILALTFAPAACAQAPVEHTVYLSPYHSWIMNWPHHVMAVTGRGVQISGVLVGLGERATNFREWSEPRACGIDTIEWPLVVPTHGSIETMHGGYAYRVAGTRVTMTRGGQTVAAYSYAYGRGITELTVYGTSPGPESFHLTEGRGMLQACLSAAR